MTLLAQVFWGGGLLLACALVHVAAVAVSIPMFRRFADILHNKRVRLRVAVMLSLGVIVTLLAHTLQVWAWAVAIHMLSSFDDFATSFYFALATYTTVGYGDVIVGEGLRIFAAFASVAGLLTFGISTAFLIGLIGRLLPDTFRNSGENR